MSMYYCPHCERKLSKTLYFQHKSFFYVKDTRQWKKERVVFASKDDFVFEDDGPVSFDSETEDVDFILSDPDSDASINQGK